MSGRERALGLLAAGAFSAGGCGGTRSHIASARSTSTRSAVHAARPAAPLPYHWLVPTHGRALSVAGENRARGTSAWRLPGPRSLIGGAARGAIEGYVARQAVVAGQRETVSSFLNDGAPIAIRGSAPDGPGYWFAPTVLAPVDPGARAAREEIFGPIAVVIPFVDEADAVALANDTIYGLSGSVWTRDGAKALRVARALECGVLSINSNTSVRVATPFGGFRQSGYGRELGPDALDAYSEVKSIFFATS